MKNLLNGRSPAGAVFAICSLLMLPSFWLTVISYAYIRTPYVPGEKTNFTLATFFLIIAVTVMVVSLILLGCWYRGVLRERLYLFSAKKAWLYTFLPAILWVACGSAVLIWDSLKDGTSRHHYLNSSMVENLSKTAGAANGAVVTGHDTLILVTGLVALAAIIFYYINLWRAARLTSDRALRRTILAGGFTIAGGILLVVPFGLDPLMQQACAAGVILIQVILWTSVFCAFTERPISRYLWLIFVMALLPVGAFLFGIGATYYADYRFERAIHRFDAMVGHPLSVAGYKDYYREGPAPNAEQFFGIDPTADTAYTAMIEVIEELKVVLGEKSPFDWEGTMDFEDSERAGIYAWLVTADTQLACLNGMLDQPYFRMSFYDSPQIIEQRLHLSDIAYYARGVYYFLLSEAIASGDKPNALEAWRRLSRMEGLCDPAYGDWMAWGRRNAMFIHRKSALQRMLSAGVFDDLQLAQEQRALHELADPILQNFPKPGYRESVMIIQVFEKLMTHPVVTYGKKNFSLPESRTFLPLAYYALRMGMGTYANCQADDMECNFKLARREPVAPHHGMDADDFRMHDLIIFIGMLRFHHAGKIAEEQQLRVRCAEIGIAVERYHRRYGNLPESLDALVPEFLIDIPVNAYDKPVFDYHAKGDEVLLEINVERFKKDKESDNAINFRFNVYKPRKDTP